MTASITAKDPYSFDNGSGGNSVSIAKGGTVTFGYPAGASFHNVVFETAQPTSCQALEKHSAGTGRTSFAVRLNRGARRALARRHRLGVTVRIAVTPDAGTAFKKTVKLVLREKS